MTFPVYVYELRNEETRRVYVGSTSNVIKRYSEHMSLLKNGKHKIEDMQKDYDDVCKRFSIHILDVILSNRERNKEYEWMIVLNSSKRGCGYNYKEKPEKYCKKAPIKTDEIQNVETKAVRLRTSMNLKKLKSVIKNSGKSMKSCAKAIGISESQFYKKMNGSQVLFLEECEDLGNFFRNDRQ